MLVDLRERKVTRVRSEIVDPQAEMEYQDCPYVRVSVCVDRNVPDQMVPCMVTHCIQPT